LLKLNEKLKTNTVGTVPKSNRKIVERNKIDTTNSQITLTIIAWFQEFICTLRHKHVLHEVIHQHIY